MTPDVHLRRVVYGDQFTLGTLAWDAMVVDGTWREAGVICTVEDAWRNNQPKGHAGGESCIPDGLYRATPRPFNRGGYDAWEITGVPGRSLILIHKANNADDVTGCIAVGQNFGVVNGKPGVERSALAFRQLYRWFGGKSFWLDISPLHQSLGSAVLAA